jgi:hypothetical protein
MHTPLGLVNSDQSNASSDIIWIPCSKPRMLWNFTTRCPQSENLELRIPKNNEGTGEASYGCREVGLRGRLGMKSS